MAIARDNRNVTLPAPPVRGTWIAWLPLSIAIALVGGLLAVLSFGQVRGVEFSPRSFQRRSFVFLQIPLVRWQFTPAWRTDETLTLEQHLRQQRLLPHRPAADRWDVVWVSEGGRRRDGNPVILTRYLDISPTGEKQTWYTWTLEHPDRAKVLWSAVQWAALLDAYELVPPLFDLATAGGSVTEFERRLSRQLEQDLAHLAVDLAAAGNAQAAQRIEKALLERAELDPQLRRLFERRQVE